MGGTVIDLFAGPGGWDLAAQALGIDVIGLELDDAACATRRAAGLRTMQCDVGAVDLKAGWAQTPVWGLIASPPCQAFSMAGKGEGRAAMKWLRIAMQDLAATGHLDRVALDDACGDPRAHLVLEPLRWALALRPRWIACEQVEPVLPLWEAMAATLHRTGYTTWTGTLSAEQYGVPQTRRRAFLLASLDGSVAAPAPTHQRYIAPRRRAEATESLFEAQEPERIVHVDDRGLLPWVSMAEALGWAEGLAIDHHRGAGMTERHGERTDRTTSQPAPTITAGGSRWSGGPRWTLRMGNQENSTERAVEEPAPTLLFGHRVNDTQWLRTGQRSQLGGGATEEYSRSVDAPAPTVITTARCGWHWTEDRPATTVAGDPRVHPPGHKVNGDDLAAGRDGYERRAGENAVRVSVAEALVLQSFPPDYPVQGTKTKVFEQVGNAVPPLLAGHVLRAIPAVADVRPSEMRVA